MAVYALTIFAGAFLVFAVQPLIAKFILPWFGGSPDVWTACMLFFQALLLVGYAYAHLSARLLSPRGQAVVHVLVVLAGLIMLPIAPDARWQPREGDSPVLRILLLLGASVSLPYFVLASTSPLMQSWLARTRARSNPYVLYALSNGGSLLALAAYPLLFEPAFSRRQQVNLWSGGWAVFAVLSVLCALRLWRARPTDAAPAMVPPEEGSTPRPCGVGTRLLWLGLPAGSAVVLLAVTNVISLDLAVVPLLWLLPLCLYLLSFVICFAGERYYLRTGSMLALLAALVAVIWLRTRAESPGVGTELAIYLGALFCCCMVCHGELYRLRPEPARLTSYYLTISAGGALGGVFVAVVAPLVFKSYLDLYAGLLACCVFALLAYPSRALGRRRWLWMGLLAVVVGAGIALSGWRRHYAGQRIASQARNFYGVLTLWEEDPDDPARHRFVLQHGTTIHGLQFTDPQRRRLPTAYYGPRSGAGLAIGFFSGASNRRLGVVGLGAGTLAAYAQEGDVVRFYEINPAVKRLAESRFTYLADCRGKADVVMGDARLSLQRQPPQQFDVLVLDAFSSDAVPVHLLTVEAFEIYLGHLKPEGVLAAHLSTHHLDLESVVFRLAGHFGLKTVRIRNDENPQEGIYASDWVLLTRNDDFIRSDPIRKASLPAPSGLRAVALWTDDHASLLEVLK